MAAKLLKTSGRLISYWPSLRVLASKNPRVLATKPARVFSSDSDHGIFGPEDRRLPLPGKIGIDSELFKDKVKKKEKVKLKPDVLTVELPHERHVGMVTEAQKPDMIYVKNYPEKYSEGVECIVQECPQLLIKDFSDLFLGVNIADGPFTIITISQRTENDMSIWSDSVEKEREELLFFFITFAQHMVDELEQEGYWADFIDPTSGKPYWGPLTNVIFTETDDRYRKLGYRIEDLGCCKVVDHHLWGTHAFIGSVFTNAPVESKIIQEMLMEYLLEKDY